MTRTVAVVGGVLTAVALVVLLAFAYLQPEPAPTAGSPPAAGSPPVAASPAAEAPRTSRTTASTPTAGPPARCATTPPATDGLTWVCLSDLPRQAWQTVALIDRGGPFPYAKDGATFNNFERVLPERRRGYYREYTVKTPGLNSRGPRRIVTGDQGRELFYTDDHYETFRRVQR